MGANSVLPLRMIVRLIGAMDWIGVEWAIFVISYRSLGEKNEKEGKKKNVRPAFFFFFPLVFRFWCAGLWVSARITVVVAEGGKKARRGGEKNGSSLV